MVKRKYPVGNENKFNEFLVQQYLRYGSVDSVMKEFNNELPISYAGYHRILDKWGVVKAAGPHSAITEVVSFLTHMIEDGVPLDKMYKKMPPSFKTSAVTMYRIYSYIKEGITRRVGVALIITPYGDKNKILVAKDMSTPRIELGKPYGALTIPMGFARKRDDKITNIKRILQHEMFLKDTVKRKFPEIVIPQDPKPFMYLDVADIRVSVYSIGLPKKLSKANCFSSYKLSRYRFVESEKLIKQFDNKSYRAGLVGAVLGYKTHRRLVKRNLSINPLQYISVLNKKLIEYSPEQLRI